ncbi:MAG TPA: hypothetical protein ENN79_10995 [Desulfobacteraceae bacterium]|nr:hypothetical protein [Desulfobacteraceae bacterium]
MKRIALIIALSCLLAGPAFAEPGEETGVIPEMRECMDAHVSQEAYSKVITKYCGEGIVCQAMGLLLIKNPYVIKTEKENSTICYTVEGTVEETSSEIPGHTTQVYEACWENGRLVSLEFFGPKSPVREEVIPEMRECMRSHSTPSEYKAVLEKYCDSSIIRQAMGLLVIREPYVVKTERNGPVITYTVEGRTEGGATEISGEDIVQVYRASWRGGKLVSVQFLGPKAKLDNP